MRPHLPLLILLGMLIPLLAMGWLGVRLADQQQAATEAQFRRLLDDRLGDMAQRISRQLEGIAQTLGQQLERKPASWQAAVTALQQGHEVHEGYFVLDPDGRLVYPAASPPMLTREQEFLHRTRKIWDQGLLQPLAGHDPQPPQPPQPPTSSRSSDWSRLPRSLEKSASAPAIAMAEPSAPAQQGWYSWYLEDGINLLFWRRLNDGGTLGMELDRIALLALLIAQLPSNDGSLQEGQIRLVDAQGSSLYQWGNYPAAPDARPAAQRSLPAPLGSWQLHYHLDPAQLSGDQQLKRLQLYTLLGSITLLLGGAALLLYREVGRGLREASQRVNFVNQVSHELKTPLTNIRMYAELLRSDLEDHPVGSRKAEIIEAEAQRLSRLIANVLTLARDQRKTLQLHPSRVSLDTCVTEVLEPFRPALERQGLKIELQTNAPVAIQADPDALSQIIANLISNVEKYAATGGLLRLTSHQDRHHTRLEVQDCGSGIAPRQRKRIFHPFYRIRSDLTEGVSGTGIGLSIARELAQLHGGTLQLKPSKQGALFVLTLPNQGPGP